MRMLPTHYTGKAQPAVGKKTRTEVTSILPPLSGLSLETKFTEGNIRTPTATVLVNFNVESDRITVRAGYRKQSSRGTAPVWHLIPHYGATPALAAASNGEIWNATDGALIKGGFASNDWHWTSFSNLGRDEHTVMVNGADGVWSWNGSMTPDIAAVPAVSVSNANPAVVTVAAADIGKFHNDMVVNVTGCTGAMLVANGNHVIASVNSPANTFQLVGVNTSSAGAPQTTGITVDPQTAFVKEEVLPPAGEAWITPNTFNIVLSHMNRLWFADNANLAVYYLPVAQKSGTLKMLPLNLVFRRGGHIRAMATWTVDGGADALTDMLVIFSSNGEAVIYKGYDPDSNFALTGIYRFDAPMSKHSVSQYGGDLYLMISSGLVAMSALLKQETEGLGQEDKAVLPIFLNDAVNYRDSFGWQTFLNPSTGRMICNVPQGAPNRYRQMVRHMPKAVWAEWADVPARSWNWIDPYVYFGDDYGNVYVMHPVYQNDDGKPINAVVQTFWHSYKTAADKAFVGVTSYLISDGLPKPSVDIKVNYDYTAGVNYPDITQLYGASMWDTAIWDVSLWAPGKHAYKFWNGVAAVGNVAAIRMAVAIDDCTFSIAGWDVHYEKGFVTP